jgi:tripartite-type tricarboxylate transporter receptor subunit TctC
MGRKHYGPVWIAILTVALLLAGSSSWALDYPTKPVTLLCGFAPGGAGDIQARALAAGLEPVLGKPVVVLNKPGATGSIMMALLKTSKPDGYTIALTPASLAVTPYFQKVEYDITKDFTYLAAMNAFAPPLTIRADAPWKTLKEFIDYGKANPNQLKIGTSGMQGSSAIMTKYVGHLAGVQWTLIPFDSAGPIITAMLGNHIHAGVNNGAQIPHVKAGTLRMLAFYTAERLKDFPEVPTFKELGYEVVTDTLAGIVAPQGLPEPISNRLIEALVKARESETFVSAIKTLYLQPQKETGKEYEKRIMEIYSSLDKYLKIK